jgi:hypothetical protein
LLLLRVERLAALGLFSGGNSQIPECFHGRFRIRA